MKISSILTVLKKYCIFIFILCGAINVQAKTDTIFVSNFKYVPDSVHAFVGDTILWIWLQGGHVTIPRTDTINPIPANAASWDHALNSSSTFFAYPLTAAGKYKYWCAIHMSLMDAILQVDTVGTLSIAAAPPVNPISVYPQSVQNELTINWNNNKDYKSEVVIDVFDLSGQRKFQTTMHEIAMDKSNINLSDLAAGLYIVNISSPSKTQAFKIVKW